MRYFLLDKIQYLEKNSRLVALKNVTLSEDVFADHFYGNPIMPGALQIESLAQAGTVLLEVSHNFTKKALLIMVNHAKFREIVRPGDQLIIEMKVISLEGRLAQLSGTVRVDEKLVTDARLTFALHEVDEFYLPKVRFFTDILYDVLLKDATLVGVDNPRKET